MVGALAFVVEKVVLMCYCTGISDICRTIVVFVVTVIVGICVVCGSQLVRNLIIQAPQDTVSSLKNEALLPFFVR